MRSIGRIGFGALGLLALACSESHLGGGANGGHGGAGGSSAGGSSGGGGGAGGGVDFVVPDCVQALIASCPSSETCLTELNDAGSQSEICFSSGVRVAFEGEFIGTSGKRVAYVSKADGAPCYSFEISLSGGELYQYIWKDPAAQVVATGMTGAFVPSQITCANGGQMSTCSGAACCGINALGSGTCSGHPSCTVGTCPDGVGGGGGGGSGGRGGAAGTTGTGGATGNTQLQLPDCVKNLVAPCATSGTCTAETQADGGVKDVCFASGVQAMLSGFVGSNGEKEIVNVTKADGTACYSFETSLVGGEILIYTWKDAAGVVVATGRNNPFGMPTHSITCEAGGETETCHGPPWASAGTCCGLSEYGIATCGGFASCATGTCP